jgi:hypothetical protein
VIKPDNNARSFQVLRFSTESDKLRVPSKELAVRFPKGEESSNVNLCRRPSIHEKPERFVVCPAPTGGVERRFAVVEADPQCFRVTANEGAHNACGRIVLGASTKHVVEYRGGVGTAVPSAGVIMIMMVVVMWVRQALPRFFGMRFQPMLYGGPSNPSGCNQAFQNVYRRDHRFVRQEERERANDSDDETAETVWDSSSRNSNSGVWGERVVTFRRAARVRQ